MADHVLGGDIYVLSRYDQEHKNTLVRLLVHESNDSSVIIYVYIGYNVWDIPPHHPVILGGKYTYAVGRTYFL